MPIVKTVRVLLLNRYDRYSNQYPVGSIQEVNQHPHNRDKWQFPNEQWIWKYNTEVISETPETNSSDLSDVVARLGI